MVSPKKKEEESSSAPTRARNLAALEAARAGPSSGASAFGVAAKSAALEWDANLEIMAAGLDALAQCVLKAKAEVQAASAMRIKLFVLPIAGRARRLASAVQLRERVRVFDTATAASAAEASLRAAIEGWEAAAAELRRGLSTVLDYGIGRPRLLDLVATLGEAARRARAEADWTSSTAIERALEEWGTAEIEMREATMADGLFSIALRALLESGADVDEGELDIQFGTHSTWASRLEGARVKPAAPSAKRALSLCSSPALASLSRR